MEPSWHYIHIDTRETMILSGWKLYIHGNTVLDGEMAAIFLYPLIKKYNLTTKIATPEIVERNKDMDIAWSSMVIYLTEQIFFDNRLKSLLRAMTKRLYYYSWKSKPLSACSLRRNISCRYDLNSIVDPSVGVDYDTYLSMYRGEYGAYNIARNPDITHRQSHY